MVTSGRKGCPLTRPLVRAAEARAWTRAPLAQARVVTCLALARTRFFCGRSFSAVSRKSFSAHDTMTSRVAAGPGSPTLAVPRAPRARAARARHPFSPRAQTGRVSDDAFPAIPPDASVLVIGASGRTGREVVRECLSRGIPVFAGTRDGAFDVAASLGEDVVAASVVPWTTPRVVPVRVDVTVPETIAGAFSLDHPNAFSTSSPRFKS